MRIVLLSVSTMVALIISVAELGAQTCRGAAPVDSVAPYQVGGGVSFSETVTGYFGTFLAGNASVFGSVRLGRNSYGIDLLQRDRRLPAGVRGGPRPQPRPTPMSTGSSDGS